MARVQYALYRALGYVCRLVDGRADGHAVGWTLDTARTSTCVRVHRIRCRRKPRRRCLARRCDFIGTFDVRLDVRDIVNEPRWSLYTVGAGHTVGLR